MKGYKNIWEMSDRELRSYRRFLRQRQERRHRILVSVLGLLAALCIALMGTMLVNSVKTNASDGFKYYTSITVENGDTLWNLADQYIDYTHYKSRSSYISEVRHINHLDEKCSIEAGQLLILPYYSDKYVR